jgi:hypothetical protein
LTHEVKIEDGLQNTYKRNLRRKIREWKRVRGAGQIGGYPSRGRFLLTDDTKLQGTIQVIGIISRSFTSRRGVIRAAKCITTQELNQSEHQKVSDM